MIWQFDNSEIYLLGSIHLMKEHGNDNLASIDEVYSKVVNLVFEASLDIEQCQFSFYENDKLSNFISKSLYRDVKKTWLKCKLQYSELEKSKIWYATSSIAISVLTKNGFLQENGVDKILWNRAKIDKKNIGWLESQSDAPFCFDSAPVEEQRNGLTKTVRKSKIIIDEISSITDAWNNCDEEHLKRIFQFLLAESPVLYHKLIIERNKLWLNRFSSALASGEPTLFVVGALHCIDKCSIQNMLLKKHNYTSKVINTRALA